MNNGGKKIIMIPYADIRDANTGVNIQDNVSRISTYMKNACVALASVKKYNPDVDVALVTNMLEIPCEFSSVLDRANIMHIFVPFDKFLFDKNCTWALAFYKLCALYSVARKYDYDYYAYLDADIYCQGSFDPLWQECREHIMLYDINHGLQVEQYRRFLDEIHQFVPQCGLITHYGGELFAASRDYALMFSEKCMDIFKEMIWTNFTPSMGDEVIVSLAAEQLKIHIKNAGAYICRLWTGSFRLLSTCYKFNPIIILHVPNEKEKGIIKLYNHYIAKGYIPTVRRVHRILHLAFPSCRVLISMLVKQYILAGKNTSKRD